MKKKIWNENLKRFVPDSSVYVFVNGDMVRIMSYARIFSDNPDCAGSVQEPVDVLNRSLGYSSLMMAIIVLWRASFGVPILDHNRVNTSWRMDPQIMDIFNAATGGFVSTSYNTTLTAWSDTDFGIVKVVKSQKGLSHGGSFSACFLSLVG